LLSFGIINSMESDNKELCAVCCQLPDSSDLVRLACQHVFCTGCLREYLCVLKAYRRLTPSKLQCLQ
jgi:hypothetical protein